MFKVFKWLLLASLMIALIQLTSCRRADVTIQASDTPTPMPTTSGTATASPTATSTASPTLSPTVTQTSSRTPSPTVTETPAPTRPPTETPTPSFTPTPTVDFPNATVNVANAHCRYGPGSAYLHAADLYEGDHGVIWNRNYAGTWLWVRFDKLNYACWVAASVTEVEGDIFSVSAYSPALPKSTLYGPPQKVTATREGDLVVVTWERVWMTEDDDRGYLIEARLCQHGYLFDVAVHTDGISYTFTDETTCEGESKGKLYTVEKHGYSDPVQIPWP